MKKYQFFSILTCMICFFCISACEKTSIQSTGNETSDKDVISNRTVENCADCPNDDDCCCSVESVNHNDNISLRFCGTSDGTPGCTDNGGPSPCNSISGGGQNISLSPPSSFRKAYCMVPGNAFSVTNLGGSTANIYLSCQYNLTHPQIVTVSIDPSSTVYYDSDTGCVITVCQ